MIAFMFFYKKCGENLWQVVNLLATAETAKN